MGTEYITRREVVSVRKGFTLAEILINMCLLAVLATLSLPFLNQKKLARPQTVELKHGIIECYYVPATEGEGYHLQAYANSSDKDDAIIPTLTDDGTACEFDIPYASYYTVQLIGRGGDGTVGQAELYTNSGDTTTTVEYLGQIRIDDYFAASLSAESSKSGREWLKEHWNDQWDGAKVKDGKPAEAFKYVLTSGHYSGGPSYCSYKIKAEKAHDAKCSGCSMNLSPCESDCTEDVSAPGGDSGKASMLTLSHKLKSNEVVEYSTNYYDSYLKIGTAAEYNRYALPAGRNGQKPDVVNGLNQKGKDGEDSYEIVNKQNRYGCPGVGVENSSCYVTTTNIYAPGGVGCNNRQEVPGAGSQDGSFVVINPSVASGSGSGSTGGSGYVTYSKTIDGVKAKYGRAGEPGISSVRTYEKLPSRIRLVPGFDSGKPTVIYDITDPNNPKQIATVAAGADGGDMITGTVVPRANDQIFPFPNYNDFASKYPAMDNSPVVGDFESEMAKLPVLNTPGRSGGGSFPILRGKLGGAEYTLNKKKLKFSNTEDSIDYTDQFNQQEENSNRCVEGTSFQQTGSTKYCKGSYGNPGAIRISW